MYCVIVCCEYLCVIRFWHNQCIIASVGLLRSGISGGVISQIISVNIGDPAEEVSIRAPTMEDYTEERAGTSNTQQRKRPGRPKRGGAQDEQNRTVTQDQEDQFEQDHMLEPELPEGNFEPVEPEVNSARQASKDLKLKIP